MQICWKDLISGTYPEADREKVRASIGRKKVLITGAAGSVGAHLTEVLTAHGVENLVLVDQWEQGLFNLSEKFKGARVFLGDISDSSFSKYVLRETNSDLVIHTAAYKHVPMAEFNPHTLVKNNVGGTLHLLEASIQNGVKSFVHISSDKVAEPAGIMGFTKEVSEKLVASYRRRGLEYYYSLRFGNILGSSGSFSDTIVKKLQSKETIHVTDRLARRFFTSLEHVSQSVLASLLSADISDVLIPKCHKELSILELIQECKNRFFGGDCAPQLSFTQLRPGEKLTETLTGSGDTILREDPHFLYSFLSGVKGDAFLMEGKALLNEASKFSPDFLPQLLK